MAQQTFLIIGGGQAGASAAATLRAEGFTGRVVLLAGEDEVPYERPPLSKDYLTGQAERSAAQVNPETWYAENDIELRRGVRVESLQLDAHEVVLTGGERLSYDKLLLATGASARRLTGQAFPEVAGVHYLRTFADAESLREALTAQDLRVVVVGAGWIGLEVAAAARGYEHLVTVLGREDVPLEAALGAELGHYFGDLHVRNGVDLRMQVEVAAFEASGGRVTGVRLADGEVVPADLVVVGIGAVPNAELADSAGLAVDDGVLVDASLSAGQDVYAAGDVANAMHPVLGQRLRVEHWAHADRQGKAAARSMLGQDVSYDRVPFFFTDQYDLGMELSGYGPLMADARVVYRGTASSGEFIAFWVSGEDASARVVGGMNVNIWDVNDQIDALVASGRSVPLARLLDPDVDLGDL